MRKHLFFLAVTFLLPFSVCSAQFSERFEDEDDVAIFCKKTLNAWTDALNNRNEENLKKLYGSIVKYYQCYFTNEQVAESHKSFFKKNAHFHQYCDNIGVDFWNGCQAQLSFDKHVQTVKGGKYKTYRAYLVFFLGEDGAIILWESDQTKDAFIEENRPQILEVDNNTPLDAIFCEANVGKKLEADYWSLVEFGEKEDGPLASMIASNGFPRSVINDIIMKDYMGQKGVYYCGGYMNAGECSWPVIYTYDSATGKVSCVGSE